MKTKPDNLDMKKLADLMERLRGPGGCPWDREQSFASLVPFIIEEAYEVVAAIDSGDPAHIKEELGDLLFQVVFVSELARELGWFTLGDVMDGVHEKMVRRHPHVFGETEAETADDVLRNWAEIKKTEKAGKVPRPGETGILAGVPEVLPALLRAHKISKRAARAGFDWPDVEGVLEKVTEEVEEFSAAVRDHDAAGMEEELGDLLFTIVNVARFVEVNPEDALRKTIGKFINRFHHIEQKVQTRGQALGEVSIEEMEELWEEAKSGERGRGGDKKTK